MMKYVAYIIGFVASNLMVLNMGAKGLIFSSLFLIPFDFVMRSLFHESWKGWELFIKMGALVLAAAAATFIINAEAKNIALGSCFGFIFAQIFAGLFYQKYIKSAYFFKVNGSDAIGILVDSIVFQLIAFGSIDFSIMGSQFVLKLVGGLFWYWVIFKKLKLQERWQ